MHKLKTKSPQNIKVQEQKQNEKEIKPSTLPLNHTQLSNHNEIN